MSVLDEVRGLVSQFRSHLTELAAADARQLQELQRLRVEVAQQADTIDEQHCIVNRLMNERAADASKHEANVAKLQAQLDHAAHEVGVERRLRWAAERLVAEDERVIAARTKVEQAEKHINHLLDLLGSIGGYLEPGQQAVLRAAREAVAG